MLKMNQLLSKKKKLKLKKSPNLPKRATNHHQVFQKTAKSGTTVATNASCSMASPSNAPVDHVPISFLHIVKFTHRKTTKKLIPNKKLAI